MKLLASIQVAQVGDAVRSKFAMVIPVIEATLRSLALDRVHRLGGLKAITLADLAREFREGSGDAGICFEYAVHDAIANQSPLIYPLASEVLEDLCDIEGGAHSILFGPEKNGTIPIIESVQDALTEESRVYVGNRGHPPKLRRYIPQIVNAFRRHEERNRLPRSIRGLWKADLFIGNAQAEKWVGTTVKIKPEALEAAQGLRVGIYPKKDAKDSPRHDKSLNLIRLPLPYDSEFMELFYKSFYLVRAFLNADARVPAPVSLPDAEDRFVTKQLEDRRGFPVVDVVEVLRDMAQQDLLHTENATELQATATLSESTGLEPKPNKAKIAKANSDLVTLAPRSREE